VTDIDDGGSFTHQRHLWYTVYTISCKYNVHTQLRTQDFFWGWGEVQQIQLRTEDRENGDLEAVAP